MRRIATRSGLGIDTQFHCLHFAFAVFIAMLALLAAPASAFANSLDIAAATDSTAHKTVFIGDSRTYFMHCDTYGTKSERTLEMGVSVSTSKINQLWVALGGSRYNGSDNGSKTGKGNGGFVTTLLPYADEKISPGDTIVIAMGANDRKSSVAKKYVNLVKKYRKTKENWRNTTIVFVSVTPYSRSCEWLNNIARSFNKILKKKAKAEGYKYVDIYTPLKSYRSNNCYRHRDGTHYRAKYSKKAYKLLIKKLPR